MHGHRILSFSSHIFRRYEDNICYLAFEVLSESKDGGQRHSWSCYTCTSVLLQVISLPVHLPRCCITTCEPWHCSRNRWHRLAYVWLSVPHTGLLCFSATEHVWKRRSHSRAFWNEHISPVTLLILLQFDVLLTAQHLSIILAINQLNAQNLYCICTVQVISLLNCQYQNMHNFNIID